MSVVAALYLAPAGVGEAATPAQENGARPFVVNLEPGQGPELMAMRFSSPIGQPHFQLEGKPTNGITIQANVYRDPVTSLITAGLVGVAVPRMVDNHLSPPIATQGGGSTTVLVQCNCRRVVRQPPVMLTWNGLIRGDMPEGTARFCQADGVLRTVAAEPVEPTAVVAPPPVMGLVLSTVCPAPANAHPPLDLDLDLAASLAGPVPVVQPDRLPKYASAFNCSPESLFADQTTDSKTTHGLTDFAIADTLVRCTGPVEDHEDYWTWLKPHSLSQWLSTLTVPLSTFAHDKLGEWLADKVVEKVSDFANKTKEPVCGQDCWVTSSDTEGPRPGASGVRYCFSAYGRNGDFTWGCTSNTVATTVVDVPAPAG
jgi:hypothetical protein